jgi:hypothetical protein
MLGDRCAYDLPAIVGQNDHHVEQAKRCGRYDEHVDGEDAFGVIAEETAPGRGRRTSSLHRILRDGRLADLNAELEQLPVDPGRTPEPVDATHLANQIANLALH